MTGDPKVSNFRYDKNFKMGHPSKKATDETEKKLIKKVGQIVLKIEISWRRARRYSMNRALANLKIHPRPSTMTRLLKKTSVIVLAGHKTQGSKT